jgi:hypothetical protein
MLNLRYRSVEPNPRGRALATLASSAGRRHASCERPRTSEHVGNNRWHEQIFLIRLVEIVAIRHPDDARLISRARMMSTL